MRELCCLFAGWRLRAWLPLLGCLLTPIWMGFLIIWQPGPFLKAQIYDQIGNVLPIFASLWPIFSLQTPLRALGGELFFTFKRNVSWWILRAGRLILLYIGIATVVAAVSMVWVGPIGLGLLWRVVLLGWFYGWLGYSVMLATEEFVWATFICFLFYLTMAHGRLLADTVWNPHRVSIRDYFHSFPIPIGILVASISVILILCCMWLLRHRKQLR